MASGLAAQSSWNADSSLQNGYQESTAARGNGENKYGNR